MKDVAEVVNMLRAELLTEIKEGTPESIILQAALTKMEQHPIWLQRHQIKDTPENLEMLRVVFQNIADYEYANTSFVSPFGRGMEVYCDKLTREPVIRETRGRNLTSRQKSILKSYDLHNKMEPGISTERLLAMVEDDTEADSDEIIEALLAAGRGEFR